MKTLSRSLRRHHRLRLKLRVLNWRFICARPEPHWRDPRWTLPYDRRWYAEEPLTWLTECGHKAWRRMQMTKPGRAQENQALRLIARGMPEHVTISRWPDHKKPFVYYW